MLCHCPTGKRSRNETGSADSINTDDESASIDASGAGDSDDDAGSGCSTADNGSEADHGGATDSDADSQPPASGGIVSMAKYIV